MKEKNIKTYGLIIGIVLFILLIAGLSYAWYQGQDIDTTTISGEIGMCFEANYLKGGNVSGDDLLLLKKSRIINNNQITITNGMAVTSISAGIDTNTCPDTYGYMDVYMKDTTLNNAFISGDSAGALKYVIASYDSSQYPTATVAALSGNTFDIIKEGTVSDANDRLLFTDPMLPQGTLANYLVIFYLDGDLTFNDGGYTNFSTTISATASPSVDGTAKSYITNLSSPTSTVVNNSITYNINTTNNVIVDTRDNVRYYGASPDNYIYFNCDIYPDTNCELWRIIGVVDGKVKLMRNENIGTFSWDTSASTVNSGNGISQWSESVYSSDNSPYSGADLMKLLNPGYETNQDLNNAGETITVNNSLYYNSGSGTCYGGKSNATKECDFTSIGIKNNTTRSKISEVTYYAGEGGSSVNYSNEILNVERGTGVKVNASDGVIRTTTWTGRVAVPYPSDYGYAADFSLCNKTLNLYNDTDCSSNNWMRSIMVSNSWLFTVYSGNIFYAWNVRSSGSVDSAYATNIAYKIIPTIYLTDTEVISGGLGAIDNPYKLST